MLCNPVLGTCIWVGCSEGATLMSPPPCALPSVCRSAWKHHLGIPLLHPTWNVQVRVKTSDIRGAGTDANVTLAMFGKLEERNTCIPATKLDNSANNFERNMIDTFMIKGTDLGDLTHIVVRVRTCPCMRAMPGRAATV